MSPTTEETAARGEYAEKQNEVLEWYGVDATERYVDLDRPAMRAHVLKCGAGNPVVFIHGGGEVAMAWAPLLARLQENFALYAPDRPGCGLSDGFIYDNVDLRQHATDFVCSLMDALDIDQADIVAYAVGGYFAFAAALDRPERIRKLAFAGAPMGLGGLDNPLWRSPPSTRIFLLVGGVPGFGKLYQWMMSRMDAESARELYEEEFNVDVSKYPDLYFDAYSTALHLPGAAESDVSFLKSSLGLRGLSGQADLSNELSGLEVPSLFLWGEHDEIVPPEVGRQCVAPIPEATFKVVDGAGHLPFNDAPDWTAERIAEFLHSPVNDEANEIGSV